jgi:hypothetical protein
MTRSQSARRAALVGLAMLLAVTGIARAEEPTSAGFVTTLVGSATVTRVAQPQAVALRFKDNVYLRDRIATEENSVVRVLLGGKAIVTARELSVLTITEDLNGSRIALQSGRIAVGVQRPKMRPGEVLEIRTHNAIVAVRGTVLVVEVVPSASGQAGNMDTVVHVLKGLVDVSSHGTGVQAPVAVGYMQSVRVTGPVVGAVQPLSPDGAKQIHADFDARQPEHAAVPDTQRKQMIAIRQLEAAALAKALVPAKPGEAPIALVKATTGLADGHVKELTEGVADLTKDVTSLVGVVGDVAGDLLDDLAGSLVSDLTGGLVKDVTGLTKDLASDITKDLANLVPIRAGQPVGGALLGGLLGGGGVVPGGGLLGGLTGGGSGGGSGGGTGGGLASSGGGAVGGAVAGLGGAVSGVSGGLGGAVSGLGGAVGGVSGGLGGAVSGLGGAVGGVTGGLGGAVGGLGGAVGGAVGGLGGAVGGLGGAVGGAVGGLGGALGGATGGGATGGGGGGGLLGGLLGR